MVEAGDIRRGGGQHASGVKVGRRSRAGEGDAWADAVVEGFDGGEIPPEGRDVHAAARPLAGQKLTTKKGHRHGGL